MGKRFSRIKYLIKTNLAMGIDMAADDNIKAFKAFRAGDSLTYDVKGTKRGGNQPAVLVPFGVTGFKTRYVTKMSQRSFSNMTTLGVTEARLNIDSGSAVDASIQGKKQPGFAPAKIIVGVPTAGGVATTPKSGITLLEYTKIPKSSYTFPFGKQDTLGQQSYVDMQGYLYAEVAKGGKSVSFKPERSV